MAIRTIVVEKSDQNTGKEVVDQPTIKPSKDCRPISTIRHLVTQIFIYLCIHLEGMRIKYLQTILTNLCTFFFYLVTKWLSSFSLLLPEAVIILLSAASVLLDWVSTVGFIHIKCDNDTGRGLYTTYCSLCLQSNGPCRWIYSTMANRAYFCIWMCSCYLSRTWKYQSERRYLWTTNFWLI